MEPRCSRLGRHESALSQGLFGEESGGGSGGGSGNLPYFGGGENILADSGAF